MIFLKTLSEHKSCLIYVLDLLLYNRQACSVLIRLCVLLSLITTIINYLIFHRCDLFRVNPTIPKRSFISFLYLKYAQSQSRCFKVRIRFWFFLMTTFRFLIISCQFQPFQNIWFLFRWLTTVLRAGYHYDFWVNHFMLGFRKSITLVDFLNFQAFFLFAFFNLFILLSFHIVYKPHDLELSCELLTGHCHFWRLFQKGLYRIFNGFLFSGKFHRVHQNLRMIQLCVWVFDGAFIDFNSL